MRMCCSEQDRWTFQVLDGNCTILNEIISLHELHSVGNLFLKRWKPFWITSWAQSLQNYDKQTWLWSRSCSLHLVYSGSHVGWRFPQHALGQVAVCHTVEETHSHRWQFKGICSTLSRGNRSAQRKQEPTMWEHSHTTQEESSWQDQLFAASAGAEALHQTKLADEILSEWLSLL